MKAKSVSSTNNLGFQLHGKCLQWLPVHSICRGKKRVSLHSVSVTDSKSSVSVADGEIAVILFGADELWVHFLSGNVLLFYFNYSCFIHKVVFHARRCLKLIIRSVSFICYSQSFYSNYGFSMHCQTFDFLPRFQSNFLDFLTNSQVV